MRSGERLRDAAVGVGVLPFVCALDGARAAATAAGSELVEAERSGGAREVGVVESESVSPASEMAKEGCALKLVEADSEETRLTSLRRRVNMVFSRSNCAFSCVSRSRSRSSASKRSSYSFFSFNSTSCRAAWN